jgi:hypothetical protein
VKLPVEIMNQGRMLTYRNAVGSAGLAAADLQRVLAQYFPVVVLCPTAALLRTAQGGVWYETAFMFNPLVGKRGRQNPFSLPPGVEAGKAIGIGLAEFQVAWPFNRIDLGDEHEFLDRWMTWFAQAVQGQLGNPSSMPEKPPQGSWRCH